MTDNRIFERILDLEDAVRLTSAARAFAPTGTPDFVHARRDQSLSSDKERLFAALDALTPEQLVEFGEYRKNARGHRE